MTSMTIINDRKENKISVAGRLQFMKLLEVNGAVFIILPADMKSADDYGSWLETLKIWHSEADKFESNAGIWIQNWKKLNKIWRNAQ